MHRYLPPKPFDYLTLVDGWTVMVKGYIRMDNEYHSVGTPIYSPDGSLTKAKTQRALIAKPDLPRYELGCGMDYVIDPASISNRRHITKTASRVDFGVYDYLVNAILKKSDAVFLFGSRSIGMATSHSDWDLLISNCKDPSGLVRNLISEDRLGVRRFNSAEINERVHRYAESEPFATPQFLTRLFRKTTQYLKKGNKEIGLFFSNPHVAHEMPLASGPLTNITGEIVRNGGRSYAMPREIHIRAGSRDMKIRTSSWVLAGIEEFAGQTISVSALRISSDTWWLGGDSASVNFHDE